MLFALVYLLLRRLLALPARPSGSRSNDNLPQVSPDGRSIVFHRNVGDCGRVIVTVNMNGGHRVQLTDPALRRRTRRVRKLDHAAWYSLVSPPIADRRRTWPGRAGRGGGSGPAGAFRFRPR